MRCLCFISVLLLLLPTVAPAAQDRLGSEAEAMINERNLMPGIQAAVRFLVLASSGKLDDANKVMEITPAAREMLTRAKTTDLLRRANLAPPSTIQFVGFNLISNDVATMLFVGTTETGPVAVKMYFYVHKNKSYLGRFETTEDWKETEQMLSTVQRLPAPYVINLTPKREDAGNP